MNNRDVELVIRAKDQAAKTVQAIVSALGDLSEAQDHVGQSATRTDGLLTQLGRQFSVLDNQVKGLAGLGQIVQQMDRAAAAVGRLEKSLELAGVEQAKFEAQQSAATAEIARLSQAFQAAKAAMDAQKAAVAATRQQLGATSTAYKEQKAALDQATAAYRQVQTALRAAEKNQRALAAAAEDTAAKIQLQGDALAKAKADYAQIDTAATSASAALEGVALTQDAVGEAARRTAAQLAKVTAALESQAGHVAETPSAGPAAQATASYRAQVAAVAEARNAWVAARNEATQLGAELARTASPTEALRTKFVLAKAASRDAELAFNAQAAALSKLRGVASNFGQFDKVVRTMQTATPAAAQMGAAVERTANVIEKSSKRKGALLFGLRPYELQNLSFQINDIITQLASGTSVTQTFAQQGGQIFQIFPRLGAVIAGALPQIIAFVAVIATIGSAMKNIVDLESSTRSFSGALAASADGAAHSAEALAATAHKLDVFGTSLKNVREELRIFLAAGIDDSQMERFGQTAENTAKVLKISVVDAAKQMADGFTRGYDAIAKLDDSLNFLSAAERAQIKLLFESGRAAEARTRAFNIFEQRMESGAQKMAGPWDRILRNFAAGWDNFLRFLGQTKTIQDTMRALQALSSVVEYITSKLPGAVSAAPSQALNRIEARLARLREQEANASEAASDLRRGGGSAEEQAQAQRALANVRAQISQTSQILARVSAERHDILARETEGQRKAGQAVVDRYQTELDELRALTNAQKLARAGARALREAQDAGADEAGQLAAVLKAREVEDERQRQEHQREFEQRSKQASDQARQRSEQIIRQQQAHLASMREQNEQRRFELELLTKTVREEAILRALRQAEEPEKSDPTKPGASLTAAQQAEIRQTTGELFDQTKVQDDLKDIEQARLDLARARGEVLTREAFVLAAAREAQIDLADAQGRQFADIQGQIFDQLELAAVEKARLDLARQMGEVVSREAFIATAAREAGISLLDAQGKAFAEIQGRIYDRERSQQRVEESEKRLNDLLQQRQLLFEQIEFARDKGDNGTVELLEDQVVDLNVSLKDAVNNAITFWTALGGPGSEAALARLRGLHQQIDDFGRKVVLTVTDANELLAGAGVNVFSQIAAKLNEGASAAKALRDSFRETAANVLLDLAQMILKQQLLNLLMKTGVGKRLSDGVNFLTAAAPLLTAGTVLRGAASAIALSARPLMQAAADLLFAAQALALTNTATSAGVLHSGGVVGAGGRRRSVSATLIANAVRYHQGGIAGSVPGLARSEVAAVLKRGEEVLTRDDPRHILNGGANSTPGTPAGDVSIKVVNVLDPVQVLEKALSTRAGERVLMNHMTSNSEACQTPGSRVVADDQFEVVEGRLDLPFFVQVEAGNPGDGLGRPFLAEVLDAVFIVIREKIVTLVVFVLIKAAGVLGLQFGQRRGLDQGRHPHRVRLALERAPDALLVLEIELRRLLREFAPDFEAPTLTLEFVVQRHAGLQPAVAVLTPVSQGEVSEDVGDLFLGEAERLASGVG